MSLKEREAVPRSLYKAAVVLTAILLGGGLACSCASGTSVASGQQDGNALQKSSVPSPVEERQAPSGSGTRSAAEMERVSSLILDDIKSRGLDEGAEGLSALEVANRDEGELRISYVWTGDEGTRWCIYVVDEGVFATPVGHNGAYVRCGYVLGEGPEPSAFVQTGTGSTDFTLVNVQRVDAGTLNEWAHENEGVISGNADDALVEVRTNKADESGQADGARAPAGDEGEDEN